MVNYNLLAMNLRLNIQRIQTIVHGQRFTHQRVKTGLYCSLPRIRSEVLSIFVSGPVIVIDRMYS